MENEITLQRAMSGAIRKQLLRLKPNYEQPAKQSLGASPILNLLTGHAVLFRRYPLFIVGAMWPLVLLAPHIPGIPRSSVNGLPWRQELALSLLLTLALGLISRRLAKNSNNRIDSPAFLVISALGLFVVWTWLSTAWAATPYAAMHLAMQWTLYLVFFLVMFSVAKSPRLLHSSFVALAGIVCMLAIACAIESWFGAPLTDGNFRNDLKPVLRGSGGFGEIMAMAAILFASLSLHLNRRRVAIACGVTAMLGWLATLQSLERAPFVGASVGFALLIAGTVITSFRSRRTLLRLCLVVSAGASILFFQTMPSLTTATNAPRSTVTRLGQNLGSDRNTRVRFLFWGAGVEMLRAHPVVGVGGNNYETAFPAARAQFAAAHPGSPLIAMNEDLLSVYAHNEYIQMLAELGLAGFSLFLMLSLALLATFWRALKSRRQTLPVLGAAGAMLAFAISSGASGSSFRYLGGGLLFFFAAALINRVATRKTNSQTLSSKQTVPAGLSRVPPLCLCAVMLIFVSVLSVQAAGTMLHGLGQTSSNPNRAERYYHASLTALPSSAATHFSYGLWLQDQGRAAEAVFHLTYAVAHGFNSSICYAYLAAAQESAGNQEAAEQVLAEAVRVYPVSVFLLVRHSVALKKLGRGEDSENEFARALSLDSRAARGWQQLIENDIDAALAAGQHDTTIALPGELIPQAAVFEILQENERRFPELADKGWRARMRTGQPR